MFMNETTTFEEDIVALIDHCATVSENLRKRRAERIASSEFLSRCVASCPPELVSEMNLVIQKTSIMVAMMDAQIARREKAKARLTQIRSDKSLSLQEIVDEIKSLREELEIAP